MTYYEFSDRVEESLNAFERSHGITATTRGGDLLEVLENLVEWAALDAGSIECWPDIHGMPVTWYAPADVAAYIAAWGAISDTADRLSEWRSTAHQYT